MVSDHRSSEQQYRLRMFFLRKSPATISLLIGLATFFWQWADGTPASPILAVVAMLSQWLAIVAGYLILLLFYPVSCSAWRDFDALIAGNMTISFLLLILVYFFGIDIIPASILTGLSIIALTHFFQKRFVLDSEIDTSIACEATYVLLVMIAIASFMSMESLRPFIINDETVVFRPWNDLFIHTANTMMMTSGDQIAEGRFEAAGEPAKFYHYGSYMLPALLFQCGFVSGLDVVTAFWSPVGLLFLALAIFTLGKYLWGPKIALLVTVLVMLIPDASYQFFRPVYFSFEWLIKASPGIGWGLAIFCLALKLMLEGISKKHLGLCTLALLGTALLLFFRAQFLIVSITFLLLVFLVYFQPLSRYQRIGIGLFTLLTGWAAINLLGSHFSNPTLQGPPGGKEFITFFLSPDYTSPLLGIEPLPKPSASTGLWILSAIFFLVLSIHGAAIILYPLGLALHKYFGKLQPFALIPSVFLLVYLIYIWYLPKNIGGNIFELQHRPFVITYLLMTLWGSGLCLYFAARNKSFSLSEPVKWLFTQAIILLLLGLQLFSPEMVNVPGREQLITAFPRGLYEVSRELEKKHLANDRFLESGLDPSEFVIAVSETRSFLSRPERQSIKGNPKRRALYMDLNIRSHHIFAADNPVLLRELCAKEGIRWLIVGPEDNFRWREKMEATYTNRGFSLYDLSEDS